MKSDAVSAKTCESPSQGSDDPDLGEIVSRVEAMSKQIRDLRAELHDVQDERDELRQENDELHARIDDLERELERLDSRTDLLNLVENSDQMDGKQRAAVLIQHLRKKALRRRDRGEPPAAELDRDAAEEALQFPDVERTTIYRDMERAARLVGEEDVLWYESGGHGGARLKIDLEQGELPTQNSGTVNL